MPNKNFVLNLITIFVLIGCTTTPQMAPQVMLESQCEYLSSTELSIEGKINEDTLNCVNRGQIDHVKTLTVNTPGGDVRAAIKIAEQFSNELHIIIDGECNSSCANYFVPRAKRLTFMPDAIMLLHGSIDEELAEGKMVKLMETRVQQTAFAQKHAVHLGWLLTRSKDEYMDNLWGHYLKGKADFDRKLLRRAQAQYVLVDEPLLRSCLPNLDYDGFEHSAAFRFKTEKKVRKKLLAQGAVGSGTLRCI